MKPDRWISRRDAIALCMYLSTPVLLVAVAGFSHSSLRLISLISAPFAFGLLFGLPVWTVYRMVHDTGESVMPVLWVEGVLAGLFSAVCAAMITQDFLKETFGENMSRAMAVAIGVAIALTPLAAYRARATSEKNTSQK